MYQIAVNSGNASESWTLSPLLHLLKEVEEDITDPLEIATHFNTFFSHITENYLTDDNRPTPSYEKLKAFVDSKIPPDAVFDIPPIEHDFVLKEPKKSCWNRRIVIKNTLNDSSCNCNSNCESYQPEYWFTTVSNPMEDGQSLPYFQKWKV